MKFDKKKKTRIIKCYFKFELMMIVYGSDDEEEDQDFISIGLE